MNHKVLCQCTHQSHTYPNGPTGFRCSKIREIRANNDLWLCSTCFDSLGLSHAAPIGTTEEEPENRLKTLTLHADTYTDNRPTLARLQDAELTAWVKLGHLIEGAALALPIADNFKFTPREDTTAIVAAMKAGMESEIAAYQAAIHFEEEATDRRKASGPIRCYAEAYRTSSAYGGPEEGGWSYTVYSLEETIPTWCHCDPMLVMKYYAGVEETGEPPTQALAGPYAHEDNCQAGNTLRDLEGRHTTEEPAKQEFTESYITAGGTWSMDSAEDAPPDHLGEVMTRSSRANYFTLSLEEAEKTDQPRPRYA